MEKKQSSIDWLVEQMIKEISKKFSVELTPIGLELIEQANAIHEEQIKRAFKCGYDDAENVYTDHSKNYEDRNGEDYYNKTYK